MIYLQHDLVEDIVRRRQQAMHAADQHAPAFDPKRLEQLEHEIAAAEGLLALRILTDDGNWSLLIQVIDQMTAEIAGARDAVEHERALRRLL